MSPLPDVWSHSGEACCELLYYIYLFTMYRDGRTYLASERSQTQSSAFVSSHSSSQLRIAYVE